MRRAGARPYFPDGGACTIHDCAIRCARLRARRRAAAQVAGFFAHRCALHRQAQNGERCARGTTSSPAGVHRSRLLRRCSQRAQLSARCRDRHIQTPTCFPEVCKRMSAERCTRQPGTRPPVRHWAVAFFKCHERSQHIANCCRRSCNDRTAGEVRGRGGAAVRRCRACGTRTRRSAGPRCASIGWGAEK